jgi:sensor c-di-GMP phosphodiesterase-like protein
VAIGAIIACLIAREFILNAAKSRLTSYATDILEQDERLAANINDTLAAANASTFPPCSDEDIALMRSLTFRSPFLKDVGRTHPGYFDCSALAGKLLHPVKISEPDIVTRGGRRIYYNAILDAAKGQRAEIVSLGKSNVVISPDTFGGFDRAPFLFSGGIVNADQHKILSTFHNANIDLSYDLMQRTRAFEHGGLLFYPRCSRTRPDCVMTAIAMKDVWAPNRPIFISSASAGALLGLGFSGMALFIGRRKRDMAHQLRRAIRNRDLNVLYQPIVDLSTGQIVAAEALVRWTDEDGYPVRPDIFIEIAEKQAFIGQITHFVLDRVVHEAAEVFREHPNFRISVNLSAMDLTDPTFLPMLDKLLESNQVSARQVGLELTERSTADRNQVVKVIRALQSRGHVVYIDDFGTGYSSLAYLHELSVDVLKVDRAFTSTIGTGGVTASIVPQILAMAKVLDLKIVVEGVELQQQATYLHDAELGIQAQGWLFGKPLPFEELRSRLAAQANPSRLLEGLASVGRETDADSLRQ